MSIDPERLLSKGDNSSESRLALEHPFHGVVELLDGVLFHHTVDTLVHGESDRFFGFKSITRGPAVNGNTLDDQRYEFKCRRGNS